MNNLERLIKKAKDSEFRLLMQFDPDEQGEEWGIKLYPDSDDDAHFFAYNTELDSAARQILDEIRGFRA